MDRRRAAGALLALAACIACSAAAPTANNQTALDLYESAPEGCYYNFQHYGEGDRIMTNEPCLNCTCHNRMLMCYLRVCPFTKAIGQDCTVEKRADQCCPIVTCPDVPVDLLTSTSTTSPAEYGATGLGKLDKYGCSINGKYFPEGSKVPPTPNKPCEHCYCIRNMTTCVMQECTLHVDGCTPIYHKDVCCPVRYSCDHPEDEVPLLDDMSTTVRPTPGFLLTTTTISPVTQMTQDCVHDDQVFSDGALIKTEKACEHCYCMKGDIVCVVQECGAPMENEGKNCTSLPPREGQCCPDTYICEGDEVSSDLPTESTTESILEKLTTLSPPRRTGVEGSGYRIEPDEGTFTEIPSMEPEVEGSGDEQESSKPLGPHEIIHGPEDGDQYMYATTKSPVIDEHEHTTSEVDKNIIPDLEEKTDKPQVHLAITNAPVSEETEGLTTSRMKEDEIVEPHAHVTTTESYEKVTTETGELLNTVPDVVPEEEIAKPHEYASSTTITPTKEETYSHSPGQEVTEISLSETSTPAEISKITQEVVTEKEYFEVDVTRTTSATLIDESEGPVPQHAEEIKDSSEPSQFASTTITTFEDGKLTTEPDHAQNTVGVAEEEITHPHSYIPSATTALPPVEEESTAKVTQDQSIVTDKDTEDDHLVPHEHLTTVAPTVEEKEYTTLEPDRGLNTIPSEIGEEASSEPPLPRKTTSFVEPSVVPTDEIQTEAVDTKQTTASDIVTQTPDITKADQYTVTTEPSFRKEDESIVSTEIQKEYEPTTIKSEFVDEGLIPTSAHDEKVSTSSDIAPEEDYTTVIPEYTKETIETTGSKLTTTESTIDTSAVTEIHSSKLPESTSEHGELFSNTEKSEDFTASAPEPTETNEEPSRIPGEGDCLLNGVTYRNNTVVPSTNNCHTGCRCASSIIKCDPIICSPPPDYMDNCQSIYDSPDSCCPTYVCDHPRETVPPQSDNQMSGTESPTPSPTIECRGDQCELSEPAKLPTGPSELCTSGSCLPEVDHRHESECGSEGCGVGSHKPDSLQPSEEQAEKCMDGKCKPEKCSNGECQLPQTQGQISPTKPCEGDNCEKVGEPTRPTSPQKCEGEDCKTMDIHAVEAPPCEGESCHKIDCDGEDCDTSVDSSLPDNQCNEKDGCKPLDMPVPDCTGDEPCRRKEVSASDEKLPAACEGPDCKHGYETTVAPEIGQFSTELPETEQTHVEKVTKKNIDEKTTELPDTHISEPDDEKPPVKDIQDTLVGHTDAPATEDDSQKETPSVIEDTFSTKKPTVPEDDGTEAPAFIDDTDKEKPVQTEVTEKPTAIDQERTETPEVIEQETDKPGVEGGETDEKPIIEGTEEPTIIDKEGTEVPTLVGDEGKEKPATDKKEEIEEPAIMGEGTEIPTIDGEKETEKPAHIDQDDKEKPYVDEDVTKKPFIDEQEETKKPISTDEETTTIPTKTDETESSEPGIIEKESTDKESTAVEGMSTDKPYSINEVEKDKPAVIEMETQEPIVIEKGTETPIMIDDKEIDKDKPVQEIETEKPAVIEREGTEKPAVIGEDGEKQPATEDDKKEPADIDKKPTSLDEKPDMKEDITGKPTTIDELDTEKPTGVDEPFTEKPTYIEEKSTDEPASVVKEDKEKPIIADVVDDKKPVAEDDKKKPAIIDEESTEKPIVEGEESPEKPLVAEDGKQKPADVTQESTEVPTMIDEKPEKSPDTNDEHKEKPDLSDTEGTTKPDLVDKESPAITTDEDTEKPLVVDEEHNKEPASGGEDDKKEIDGTEKEGTEKPFEQEGSELPVIVKEENTEKPVSVDEGSIKKPSIIAEDGTMKPLISEDESTTIPDIPKEKDTDEPAIIEEGTEAPYVTEKEETMKPILIEKESTQTPTLIDDEDTERPDVITEKDKETPVSVEEDGTKKPVFIEQGTDKPSIPEEEGVTTPIMFEREGTELPDTVEGDTEKPVFIDDNGEIKPDEEQTVKPIVFEEDKEKPVEVREKDKPSTVGDEIIKKPVISEVESTEVPKAHEEEESGTETPKGPTTEPEKEVKTPEMTEQPTESTADEIEKITKAPIYEPKTTIAEEYEHAHGTESSSEEPLGLTTPQEIVPPESPEVKVTESHDGHTEYSGITEITTESLIKQESSTKLSEPEQEKEKVTVADATEPNVPTTTVKLDSTKIKEEGSTSGPDMIIDELLFTNAPELPVTTESIEKITEIVKIGEQEEVSTDTTELDSRITKAPEIGPVFIEPQEGTEPEKPEQPATSKTEEESTTKVYQEEKLKPVPESHVTEMTSAAPDTLITSHQTPEIPEIKDKEDKQKPELPTTEADKLVTQLPVDIVKDEMKTEQPDKYRPDKVEITTETQGYSVTEPVRRFTEIEDPFVTGQEDISTGYPEKIDENIATTISSSEKPYLTDMDTPKLPEETPEPHKPVSGIQEQSTLLPESENEKPEITKSPVTEIPISVVTESQEPAHVTEKEVTSYDDKTTQDPELIGEKHESTLAPEIEKEEQESVTEIPQDHVTASVEHSKTTSLYVTEPHTTVIQETDTKPGVYDVTDTQPITTEISRTSDKEEEVETKAPEPMYTDSYDSDKKTELPEIQLTSEIPQSLVTDHEENTSKIPEEESSHKPEVLTTQFEEMSKAPVLEDNKTETPVHVTESTEVITKEPVQETTDKEDKISKVPEEVVTEKQDTLTTMRERVEDVMKSTEHTSVQTEISETTTPYLIELEEHTHKIAEETTSVRPSEEEHTFKTVEDMSTSSPAEEYTHKIEEHISTVSPIDDKRTTVLPEAELEPQELTTKVTDEEIETATKEAEATSIPSKEPEDESNKISDSAPVEGTTTAAVQEEDAADHKEYTTSAPTKIIEESTMAAVTDSEKLPISESDSTVHTEKEISSTEKPQHPVLVTETPASEEESIFSTTKATTVRQGEDIVTPVSDEKLTKPEEKPSETSETLPVSITTEVPKPGISDLQPTDEVPTPDEEGSFPSGGTSGYGETDYVEEDQAFGPGTCRYGGKVYVSAQQIPRDDPCDFCFCFRSDIICLQQSCPPPIHGCHEEPIQGFCCPRYECPVSMATTVNVTTTTTTTTTTLPPHFPTHSYKGAAQRRGCQIKGHSYKVGEVVRSSSGPCLHCTCGGDGQMKCDPKACTPEPMLRQMIAAAVSAKRRR